MRLKIANPPWGQGVAIKSIVTPSTGFFNKCVGGSKSRSAVLLSKPARFDVEVVLFYSGAHLAMSNSFTLKSRACYGHHHHHDLHFWWLHWLGESFLRAAIISLRSPTSDRVIIFSLSAVQWHHSFIYFDLLWLIRHQFTSWLCWFIPIEDIMQ